MLISDVEQSDSVLHVCVSIHIRGLPWASLGFPSTAKNPSANAGDEDSSPGWGRCPGEMVTTGNH